MKKNPKRYIFLSIKKQYYKIEESIEKNPKRQFIYFIIGFLIFYLILNFLISFFPKGFFESFVGLQINFLINLQGISTQTFFGEQFVINLIESGKTINIVWLCTGILEMIILISTIIVTFKIGFREKIIGIISAIIIGHLFNLLRIIITINIYLTQNSTVLEFAHDFLFKATLFLYIIIVYVFWFYWGIKKTQKKK